MDAVKVRENSCLKNTSDLVQHEFVPLNFKHSDEFQISDLTLFNFR